MSEVSSVVFKENPRVDLRSALPTQDPLNLNENSILGDVVNFWRWMPIKWLQEGTHLSKRNPGTILAWDLRGQRPAKGKEGRIKRHSVRIGLGITPRLYGLPKVGSMDDARPLPTQSPSSLNENEYGFGCRGGDLVVQGRVQRLARE